MIVKGVWAWACSRREVAESVAFPVLIPFWGTLRERTRSARQCHVALSAGTRAL